VKPSETRRQRRLSDVAVAEGWEGRCDMAGSALEGHANAATGGGEDVVAAVGWGSGGAAPPWIGKAEGPRRRGSEKGRGPHHRGRDGPRCRW